MGKPGHEGGQPKGVVGLGRTAAARKQLDAPSGHGTKAAGEVIPIVSVSFSGGCGEEAASPDCHSGLESSSKGQEGGRIGNGPLKERKDKQDQSTKQMSQDFVRGKLQKIPQTQGTRGTGS